MTLASALVGLALVRVTTTDRLRNYVVLGVVSGLGLLVKATFLPLVGVVFGYLLLLAHGARNHREALTSRLKGLATFTIVVAALTLWWYLAKLAETGNLVGAGDLTKAEHAGGVFSALHKPEFVRFYLRGWLSVVGSFLWSSTWSFVKPPIVTIAPILVAGLLILAAHPRWLSRSPFPFFCIPVATAAAYAVGLGIHLVGFIAAYGTWGTPGWYLHSSAPILATMVGSGLCVLFERTWTRWLVQACLVYSVVYLLAVGGLEAMTFSGCGSKLSEVAGYDYPAMMQCMGDGAVVAGRLAVISSPFAALIAFGLAILLTTFGLIRLVEWDRRRLLVSGA